VEELQRQLQRIGGNSDNSDPGLGTNKLESSIYPSIRQLPQLGVSYGDLYRTSRVQEAVFETLTREYELTKVQEAKETPSVKMIDPPNVPARKSFPPRAEITIFGTILATFMGTAWIFSSAIWEETDSQNPHKALASEMYQVTKAHLPWASQNRFGISAARKQLWAHLRRRQLGRVRQ
jgi:hypothetical protein